jgi:glycosyltransferase involved in cell wall biosynthesis
MNANFGQVLVFSSVYQCKITDGGPSGFLAHNLMGREESLGNYIVSADLSSSISSSRSLTSRIVKKMKGKMVFAKAHFNDTTIEKSSYQQWSILARDHFQCVHAEKYKFIYFHDVWTLYFCLDLLKDNQTVILQSHCPQVPSEEVESNQKSSQVDFDLTRQCEAQSFARANVVVFPNPNSASIYSSLIGENSKIEYLVSGAKERKDLRLLPLKEDTINFLYIGRRNSIKGFDIVLDGFKLARRKRKDISLVVAGSGETIDEDGVYDIGFTTSPHDWIFSCDYVLNCNRQSYLDLSVLEALSIGTPIILTATSGHEHFSAANNSGIIGINEASKEALESVLLSSEIKKKFINQKAVENNRQEYIEKYSDFVYRKNLEELLNKIIAYS